MQIYTCLQKVFAHVLLMHTPTYYFILLEIFYKQCKILVYLKIVFLIFYLSTILLLFIYSFILASQF